MTSLRAVKRKSGFVNRSIVHEESNSMEDINLVENDSSYEIPLDEEVDETISSSSHGKTGVEEQQEGSEDKLLKRSEEKLQKTSEEEKLEKSEKEKRSQIWNYFELISNNKYQCILCSEKLNYLGDSTSNFCRHMRRKHSLESRSLFSRKTTPEELINCHGYNRTDKEDLSYEIPSGAGFDETNSTSCGGAGVEEQKEKSGNQRVRSKKQKCSEIWSYFKLVLKNKYECILCSGRLNYIGGSSSNFYRHMRTKHPAEPISSYPKKTTQKVIIDCYGDSGTETDDAVEERVENKCPKETRSQVNETSYDASQPWRFFDILSGNAACRLCFRSLSYRSIADLAVLVNHLKSKHSISFYKNDSAGLLEVVNSEESCSTDFGSKDRASPDGVGKIQRKFEIYFTDFDDKSATCNMCLSSVSFTQNKKSLISHLYREHKNFFSKRYPTFWHFSKCFNQKTSTTVSYVDNSTTNSKTFYTDHSESGERFSVQQEMDSESDMKHTMSYPDNITAQFMKLDKNRGKCKFCSKCISYKGNVNILEQHIYNEHRKAFIQKILDEMVFCDENINRKATSLRLMDKSSQGGQQNSSNENLLSYFKPLENLQFKCKICFKLLSLENYESFNRLYEHVWNAHMSKIFKSIVCLRSFGSLELNQEKSNPNNKTPGAFNRKKKPHNINLDSIKWVRPRGKSSKSWKYFLIPNSELPLAKCRLCNHILSIKSANISNLARHLNLKHSDQLRRNLNMCYENARMFCKDSKMKIVKKYLMREIRKSLQCRLCFAHFSERKSLCKHIQCKHKNYDYSKEIRNSKTVFLKKVCASKVISNKKIRFVKCKLCEKYFPYSRREILEKHMKEKHTNAYNMGVIFEQYKGCGKKILTVNDEMDVIIETSPSNLEVELKDNSYLGTFYIKSGSSYAKCKICRKFISKSIHCRHKIPSIFSLSFSVQSMKMSKKLITSGRESDFRKIYCCSLNLVKNYCDICLKNPTSSICRCNVNQQFTLPPLINISAENADVLSTHYLQDIPRSERKAYAILFSINYFEKSCCLLCSEKIFSQGSNLLSCFDHFRLKHGTLIKNLNTMTKSIERRKLFDNVDYEGFLNFNPFGLKDTGKQCSIESDVISEQPSNILNLASENLQSELHVYSENPTSSFNVVGETHSSVLAIANENLCLDVANKNLGLDVANENLGLDVANATPVSEIERIPEKLKSFVRKRRYTSCIWKFFTKVGLKAAVCNACQRVWKFSSVYNLARHLKNKHPRLAQLLQHERAKKYLPISGTINSAVDRTSKIWMYYKKLNNGWAECNKCKRYISLKSGSIGSLKRHLQSKNCIDKESDKEVLCRLTDSAIETRKNTSSVWRYFQKSPPDKAVCSICQKEISIKNNNISNLARHLRSIHRVYIIPSSYINVHAQVLALQDAPDNSTRLSYEYIVDEQLNNSDVTDKDSQTIITNAVIESANSGENFLLEETFPPFIAEEVVGALDPIQRNDSIEDNIPETINLDTFCKKNNRSPSWKYFTKLANGRVECMLCYKTLSFKSNKCINNLTRHLKLKHASVVESKTEEDNEKCIIFLHDTKTEHPDTSQYNKEKTSYLWKYFSKSESGIVTCELCLENVSFKSHDIRNLRRHLEVKHLNVLNDIQIHAISPIKRVESQ